jgi:hypothetical protein
MRQLSRRALFECTHDPWKLTWGRKTTKMAVLARTGKILEFETFSGLHSAALTVFGQ